VEALIRQSKQARKASFSGSDKSDSMSESVTPANGTAVSYKPDVDYTTLPLTIQGELLVLCVQSGITNYPHPAVALQFFECATRYSEFFRVRPDVVQPTLAALLDARGIHNPTAAVRERAFYLFHKFIKDIKPNMSVDYVPGLLESMAVSRLSLFVRALGKSLMEAASTQDLLAIKPTMPERESPEEDLLLKATTVNTESFDAQCYLFETVGILVSMIRDAPQQQLALLQAAVNPLLSLIASEIQKPVSPVNLMPVLSVHHAIMALGNIARGFPDPTERGLAMEAPLWISVMKQSTEAILATLERLNTYKIIRDAVGSRIQPLFSLLRAALLTPSPLPVPIRLRSHCLNHQHTHPRLRRHVCQCHRRPV
jgi:exportin-T